MIDPFCTGFSAIDFLRRKFEVPLYVHRVGYGLHALGTDFSISYELFTKLFRLLGADFSHVGGIWGGSPNAKSKISIYLSLLRETPVGKGSLRETWPVVSGISLENMGEYHDFYGNDTLFLEHIDIYHSASSAHDKLVALKNLLIPSLAGGAR
jgi:ribulose 1,5-bisphosphate carboxylase large subunit-like protein